MVLERPLVLLVVVGSCGSRCTLPLHSWTLFFLSGEGKLTGATGQEDQSAARLSCLSCPRRLYLERPLGGFAGDPLPLPFLFPAASRWDWEGLGQRTERDFSEFSAFRLFTRREKGGGGVPFNPLPVLIKIQILSLELGAATLCPCHCEPGYLHCLL